MVPTVFLNRVSRSLKKEIIVVSGVVFFVLAMPLVTLSSITNLSALDISNSNYLEPSIITNVFIYSGPVYPGDLYDFGNCTFWVSMRRAEVGKPIPNSWGNAATWAVRAQLGGYKVDHTPAPYAIMQTPYVDNGLGHVAFVESVDPNGDWHISEMNVVGFDEVDYKTMTPSAASEYNFIH